MARALHLLKGPPPDAALATIEHQLAAGDTVTVLALPGADTPPAAAGVAVRRVPDDVPWETLLESIFEADQVIAWS